MDSSTLAILLDSDIDDISKAAIALGRDDRRRILSLAAGMLGASHGPLRTLKTLRFIQAALSNETNGKLPIAQVRIIGNAVLNAASGSDAPDVHRAVVDVLGLLAVKSDADRSNLSVLAKLVEKSPRDPYGSGKPEASKSEKQPPATRAETTGSKKLKHSFATKGKHSFKYKDPLKATETRKEKSKRAAAQRKQGA
jgi:hypothetical protein